MEIAFFQDKIKQRISTLFLTKIGSVRNKKICKFLFIFLKKIQSDNSKPKYLLIFIFFKKYVYWANGPT